MTTPYTTGTVTLTNGSAVVTGTGTAWATALIVGGIIYAEAANGNAMPILTVDSDTQITAATKWKGASGTYPYALVVDTTYDRQVLANATALAQILQALQKPSISALSALTPAADKVPYFTAANTAALTGLTATGRDIIDSADVPAAQTALGISAFIKGLLDDANAGAALTTLGVSDFIKTLLDDADAVTARGTLGAQAALGYTPVQQGTGVGQGANAIKIGYDSANARLKATVDTTDLGAIWTDSKGTATLGSPLFVKLPNGLILQAFALAQASSDYSAAFPTAFPTACLGVWFNQTFGITTSQFIGISTSNITKTVFDIRTRNISNGGTVAGVVSVPVIVFAIGF